MVHDLNPKNLHINGLIFYFYFAESQKIYFRVFGGIIPQIYIFSQKSGSISFLP